jgi:GNAT superfamily N-acetyltransferase
LRDGGRIRLRALTTLDRPEVAAFFSGLSLESQRLRFFRAHPSLLPEELERIISLDPETTLALAAIDESAAGDRIVGVAELAALDGDDSAAGHRRAEFAVTVGDAHQGHGIGSVLLARIAAVARSAGIDDMVAYVLPDNSSMLDVIHHSGLKISDRNEPGHHLVVISTAVPPVAPSTQLAT